MKPTYQIFLIFLIIPLFCIASYNDQENPRLGSLEGINGPSATNSYQEINSQLKGGLNHLDTDVPHAVNLIEDARERSLQIGFKEGLAQADYVLGLIRLSQNELQTTLQLFTQSSEVFEQIGRQRQLTSVLTNLGLLQLRLNKMEEAEVSLSKVLSIEEGLDNQQGQIAALRNLAKIDETRADFPAAVIKYKSAYQIATKLQNEFAIAAVLAKMGACYVAIGDINTGTSKLQKALALEEKLGNEAAASTILTNLTAANLASNKLEQALQLSEEALKIGIDKKDEALQLAAYEQMVKVQVALQNFEEAFHIESTINKIIKGKTQEQKIDLSILDLGTVVFEKHKMEEVVENNSYLNSLSRIYVAFIFFIIILTCYGGIRMMRAQERINKELEEKNEELEMSKSALEKIAYATSHDLREPLRNIGSFSSLIGRRFGDKLGKEGSEYIDFIVRGVDQMYKLLDDLRIYSSFFQDDNIPHRQVNLKEVLNAVELSIADLKEANGVKVSIPDQLPEVMGSPIQMHHLFLNLVNNAIQHNDKPFPTVAVECEELENALLFKVIDNGIGIDAKYHQKIFHAFKRLSSKQQPGCGVGLAVCKKIVEKHKGSIWLESLVGEGSTFSFTIPRKSTQSAPLFQKTKNHSANPRALGLAETGE